MLRNLIHTSWFTLLLFTFGCQFAPPAPAATVAQAPAATAEQAPAAQLEVAQEEQDEDPQTTADEDAATDENGADEEEEADKKADEEEEEEKKKDESVIKAYFLSTTEHQIASRPEEWTSELRVEEAVPHGVTVGHGDVLVQFRSRKFDQAIEDQQHTVTKARLALDKADLELEHLRKSKRVAMADAERAEQHATENLTRFVTTELDQRKEALEFNTKSSEDYLAYSEEELKQLTKMYEADDLTEETEEIVLRRTRDDVERSRHRLMVVRQSMERGFEVDLPRSRQQLEVALKKANLEREKTVAMAEAELAEKEVGLEKLRRDLHRAEQRMARLTADRKWLTLKAPISGLVYHGKQHFGKWSDPSQLAASLRPGGVCKPQQVLMTVVEPAVDRVVGTMNEADFAHVAEERDGKLVISAYPQLECSATVAEISPVPVSDGKFLVTMQPRLPEDVERLVPGMTCEVTFKKSE